MASSLISGTVALILILVTGYVIASGILVIAQTTINAQTLMTGVHEDIKETQISIPYYERKDGARNNNRGCKQWKHHIWRN